jgi:lysozyme family protein
MEDRFSLAMSFVQVYEGGYVNDPRDTGGETNFGISKRQYPHLDIKNLTLAQAKEIYRKDYWEHYRCHEMPWPLAMVMFDSYVQFSPSNPTRWMQRALGLRDDGVFGPKTLEAVRSAKNPLMAARAVMFDRGEFRVTRPNYDRFGRGWRRRDIALMCEAARGWDGN